MAWMLPTLADTSEMFWIVGGTIAVIAILCGTICTIAKTSARERSRRELAAYIAEGSISAAEGERLMNAGDEEE